MPDAKIDLYGSTQVRSSNRNRERAVRRAFVTGIDNDISGLNAASGEAATEAGLTHPNYGSGINALPLLDVTTKRFGPSKALCWLSYQRSPLGQVEYPGPEGSTQFIGRVAYVESRYTRWYSTTGPEGNEFDAAGLPNGPVNGVSDIEDPEQEPVSYPLAINYYRFVVPFISATLATVDSLVGFTNNGAVTLGSFTFAQGTLEFAGPTFDWYEINGEAFFSGQYVFNYAPQGHVGQIVWFNQDIGSNPYFDVSLDEDTWQAKKVVIKPQANFLSLPGATS